VSASGSFTYITLRTTPTFASLVRSPPIAKHVRTVGPGIWHQTARFLRKNREQGAAEQHGYADRFRKLNGRVFHHKVRCSLKSAAAQDEGKSARALESSDCGQSFHRWSRLDVTKGLPLTPASEVEQPQVGTDRETIGCSGKQASGPHPNVIVVGDRYNRTCRYEFFTSESVPKIAG